MFSLTCKTAIKAVIYLASRKDSEQKCGIKEIAEYIGASEHTVGKFLQTLVKNDVIKSAKGPSGGFYLSDAQMLQPVINIVYAIDGVNIFNECGLGLRKCSASQPCPIHNDYKKARDLLENLFKDKKVVHLCEPVSGGAAFLFI
jgi:Rrf2 family protein